MISQSPSRLMFETFVEGLVNQIAPQDVQDDPWARERRLEQTPPPGNWRTWLVMAGRGFGKTRTGAEWIREEVMAGNMRRVALVAPTAADARDVMVEGESGMLAVCDRYDFRPTYEPSKRKLTFPNGAQAWTYSADEPDRLRGPQHDGAWSDEIATWRYVDTWSNLQFGLRLGRNPRQVATTTPRPVALVKDLLNEREDGNLVITAGSTYDNRDNLAPAFLAQTIKKYEGTRLGRQELRGELLTDVPGALWTQDLIDRFRIVPVKVPQLVRVAIGVDPQAGEGENAAETGIVGAGVDKEGHGYVLGDMTLSASPHEWASAVVAGFRRLRADRVVVEINNGGAMVSSTLRTIDRRLPIETVHASRGKITRAEPVAALYERGLVHHVGIYPELEDQMTSYDGTGDSPDRMDALVWALTDLMLGPRKSTMQWIGAA